MRSSFGINMKIFYFGFLILLFFFWSNNGEVYANMKKTIAIDLDGVLDNYSEYTEEIPPIRNGAKSFIVKLSKDYELVLFTTRNPKSATTWLINNKIDKYFKDVTNVKIPAYIYIDDRNIRFNGDYSQTLEEIANFKVYWKK